MATIIIRTASIFCMDRVKKIIVRHTDILLSIFLVSTILSSSPVHAQQLFKYKNSKGTITFTTTKPKKFKYEIVRSKKPKYSLIVHRGLAYNWSSYPKPSKYDELIREMAKEHKLEPALVKAVMHVESAFNPHAKSRAGAQGLMQLIPATAQRFGVVDPYHPIDNLSGGMKYLRWLYDRFEGNLTYVLAGYNAGEGAVDQYKGIPPYRETQDYVKKVLKMTSMYRNDFTGKIDKSKKQRARISDNSGGETKKKINS